MSSGNELPSGPTGWRTEVSVKKPRPLFEYAASGSKISHEQFLALRVLWIPSGQDVFSKAKTYRRWLSENKYTEAKELLNPKTTHAIGWPHYLNSLTPEGRSALDQVTFPVLGTFSLVRLYQSQAESVQASDGRPKFKPITKTRAVTRAQERPATPTPASGGSRDINSALTNFSIDTPENNSSSYPAESSFISTAPSTGLAHASPVGADLAKDFPAAEDEAIVNTALLLFLNAIVMHFEKADVNWNSHRKAFKVLNQSGDGFEARVDGYLRRVGTDDPMAIIEVKPCLRSSNKKEIRMQEATQMAAWISSLPDFHDSYQHKAEFSRLHISQDRHEIYLNFATYNSKYVDLVRGKYAPATKDDVFLRMYEYGPFSLDDEKEIRHVAWYILAYILQQSD